MRRLVIAILTVVLALAMTMGMAFANHKSQGKGPHQKNPPGPYCAGLGVDLGGMNLFCLAPP